MAYKKGQTVEAVISDVGEGDKSFARLDDGMSLFVRGPVSPGDRIEARLFKIKKKYVEGRLDRILEPSPDRVDPRCEHFGLCGGCKWQHFDDQRQLGFK
ncbi:MAG: TRAM domain-containing protein, partial [Verrucomicrobiota bacterium]